LLDLLIRIAIYVVEVLAQTTDQPTNFVSSACHREIFVRVGRHSLGQAVTGVSETVNRVA
jgi:hypothetical protein